MCVLWGAGASREGLTWTSTPNAEIINDCESRLIQDMESGRNRLPCGLTLCWGGWGSQVDEQK